MTKQTGMSFKPELVIAILEGKKTQTRRLMKPQLIQCDWFPSWYLPTGPEEGIFWPNGKSKILALSPYGQPGDLIYVRETWQHGNYPLGPYEEGAPVYYRADFLDDPDGPDGEKSPQGKYRDWQPSTTMPKSAARIWLEITNSASNACKASPKLTQSLKVHHQVTLRLIKFPWNLATPTFHAAGLHRLGSPLGLAGLQIRGFGFMSSSLSSSLELILSGMSRIELSITSVVLTRRRLQSLLNISSISELHIQYDQRTFTVL